MEGKKFAGPWNFDDLLFMLWLKIKSPPRGRVGPPAQAGMAIRPYKIYVGIECFQSRIPGARSFVPVWRAQVGSDGLCRHGDMIDL